MKTRIIILAAGKGTRMGNGIPKVLTPFRGKPLIEHLLLTVKDSGVDPRPIIVVGHGADTVMKTLGDEYEYVHQKEQFGTGHAVRCAKSLLQGKTDAVLTLYGDHPLVSAETIKRLENIHWEKGEVLTLAVTTVDDFSGWRTPLADFGRVVRDTSGNIASIVEAKDATPDELTIREVNPSFFCFSANWLWENLSKLTNQNAKCEYYLTDLVGIAMQEGHSIPSLNIKPLESIGVNSLTHLEIANGLA